MKDIIKKYYEKSGIQAFIVDDKIRKFNDNPDISKEFEYWIVNHEFKNEVCIEGYTVSDITKVSPFLNGEGAFMMLIELRDNPSVAKKQIEKGFKIK